MNEVIEEQPKKAGRPRGKRDKKPRLTVADIKRAEMMFITGSHINTIKKALGISSTNVIYKHIEKDGWLDKREKYLQEREQNYLKTMMEQSIKETDAVLDDLKIIKGKALDGISNIDVDKIRFGEASQSFLSATEMERKVRSEGVELGFISVVAKVLKDCIQDPKTLAIIAEKLKKEFDVYRGRPILSTPVQIEENAQS